MKSLHNEKIISFFNKFNGKNSEILNEFYSNDVQFQDPITQTDGLDELKKHYTKSYQNIKSIRFDFSEFIATENKYSCTWVMTAAVNGLNSGKEFQVSGVSVLYFNSEGLITYHRDYFDLSEMVYEKIPLIGSIVRGIKNKLK
jgi:limonene-1,2-epoxide hydrolase